MKPERIIELADQAELTWSENNAVYSGWIENVNIRDYVLKFADLLMAERSKPVMEMPALTEDEWNLIAKVVSSPVIATWLIRRAQETPYFHLDGYMQRWWLFNPTPPKNDGRGRQYPDLPSARIHHILRADLDRHPHDHPFNARSIILRGWYTERRDDGVHQRKAGDTFEISADTFHHIEAVSEGGVWTMFISGEWKHSWGFRTEEGKVPWREYLGIPEGEEG